MQKRVIMRLMESDPKSIYDVEPDDEPWFLPETPADLAPTDMPWAAADQRKLVDPNDWQRAENRQGRGLVQAAAAFARLDERLRGKTADRLALQEVSELLWAGGDRIESDRIALYVHLRESTLENAQSLSAADWAIRRMLGNIMPADDLAGFLGRHLSEYDGLADVGSRAVGQEFDGITADWLAVLAGLENAHPFTRAAAGFHAWRVFGLSEPGAVLEAAVAAGKVGAVDGRAIGFLPIALGDRYALLRGGSVNERLEGWLKAVENACLRALMLLEQLEDWKVRALAATSDLSGRTPPELIDALLITPVLSAGMAAEMSGASKAAIQRNLAKFEARGLIREVTGQGRYRFWRADL